MTIILFDIDGTLTPSGQKINIDMINILDFLHKSSKYTLGLVGGGTYEKISYQMGEIINIFKYIFSECGAVIHIDNIKVYEKKMVDNCNRLLLNKIIKQALHSISEMPIIYSGGQIDFRKGLIYVSPPGMQADMYERNYFLEADQKYNLRQKLLSDLKTIDKNDDFEISFGGSVGIAIHPYGWNKSQVVPYLCEQTDDLDIYYFGDRTEPDGNDYPIYSHELIKGISVIDYTDTIKKLKSIFIDANNQKN
ncbi:phosphomannomutase [Megavirus courdo11]|uniref:phosphomannomutase n=2 Tax=Megavirus TaxID=3044761 RepID=K7YFJ2_9VIRU|nr:phosphomannomutase [Megavirus courdo7]AFX92752.1 phosphomannomutase [Megavirus courdo11]AVL93982.1 phosphomannomutase [Megavirus vitis]